MIPISHLDPAEVLIALYNAAFGDGYKVSLRVDTHPLTPKLAREVLDGGAQLEEVGGRTLRIDLSGPELDPTAFDRHNGLGSARKAIESLRSEDAPT